MSKQPNVTQGQAIAALLLNILLLPGLGTVIWGNKEHGIWQIALYLGGFVIGILLTITIVGALIGIPIMFGAPFAAWIWGLVSGIQIVQKAK